MRIITILDTATGSLNKGDEIIMESARRGLEPVVGHDFHINIPSHLAAFPPMQSRGSGRVNAVTNSELKFACGTDMFWTNMWWKRNPCYNINMYNYRPFVNTIFMGVGYSDKDFTEDMNWYTKTLWKKVLSSKYVHSTRDEKTKELLHTLGFEAINTGCPTLWGFTPEFCAEIPSAKAPEVVTTVSNHTNVEEDEAMLALLKSEYDQVYLWLQGIKDMEYIKTLKNAQGIKLIAPELKNYREFLQTHDVDFVGPRLHAGVFAMQNKRRAIILSVDHRAIDFADSFHLPVFPRGDIDTWGQIMVKGHATEIKMNFDNINKWRNQFIDPNADSVAF